MLEPYTVIVTLDGEEGKPFVIQSQQRLAAEGARQVLAGHLGDAKTAAIVVARGEDPENLEWIGAWDWSADGGFVWQEDS